MNTVKILEYLKVSLTKIFEEKLVGIYLFGSLTYNDFTPSRSDIDLVAVISSKANKTEMDALQQLYHSIQKEFPIWAKRVECSFVTIEMLTSLQPPLEPRPYFGEAFYQAAPYGNEWIINNYLIYKYGKTLAGKDVREVFKPIEITDVKEAIVKDFKQEWLPKLNDAIYLGNSHYCSYLVLNLCRILYTIKTSDLASKKASATWVMQQHPQFENLITNALNWKYGLEFNSVNPAKELIRFVESEISTTQREQENVSLH